MVLSVWVSGLLSFAMALGGTALVRRYALKRGLLDRPGKRSSHRIVTPRGGGVSIIVATLLLASLNGGANPLVWCLSATLIAAVGLVDDHGHVAARWRLGIHSLAVFIFVAFLCPPDLLIGPWRPAEWLATVFWFFLLIWFVNLFNFMDGINGLAALQSISVCGGMLVLALLGGDTASVWLLLPVLGASAGFLVWNFPRARIFMGDGGSGFIGFCLGAQCFFVSSEDMVWGGLILMGCFVVDATVTLLRRLALGEPIYQAHRTHAYQYAARRYQSHSVVTLAFTVINLCWLLPWAGAVVMGWVPGIWALTLSYSPLVILALAYGAGRPEHHPAT